MKRMLTLGVLVWCLGMGVRVWSEERPPQGLPEGPRPPETCFVLNVTADRSIIPEESMVYNLVLGSADQYQARNAGLEFRVEGLGRDQGMGLYSLSLKIRDVKNKGPEAVRAFAKTLVERMEQGLAHAYQQALRRLQIQCASLMEQRDEVREKLEILKKLEPSSEVDPEVKKRLDTLVDLSSLTSTMAASDAFDRLRRSIDPPLNVVVLWNELSEEADVGPDTPIGMDGLRDVKLGTALDLMVKALYSPVAHVGYSIEDNVIVVKVQQDEGLDSQQRLAVAQKESPERIMDRRRGVLLDKEKLEIEVASVQARRAAVEEQIRRVTQEVQGTLEQDTLTREYEPLLKALEGRLAKLPEQTEEYLATLEKLMDTRARLQEHRTALAARAGGDQLTNLNNQLLEMALDLPGQNARLDILTRQLAQAEEELAAVTSLQMTVKEIRFAEEALWKIEERIRDLNETLNGLQRPTVTCIGLD